MSRSEDGRDMKTIEGNLGNSVVNIFSYLAQVLHITFYFAGTGNICVIVCSCSKVLDCFNYFAWCMLTTKTKYEKNKRMKTWNEHLASNKLIDRCTAIAIVFSANPTMFFKSVRHTTLSVEITSHLLLEACVIKITHSKLLVADRLLSCVFNCSL